MKQFAVAVLFIMSLALIGCGSDSSANPNNVNGNWNASLMSGGNSPVLTFGTTMAVNNDGSIAFANFSFTTNSPCFTSGETETGSFTLSGDLNGNVNGKFGMTVHSGTPAGNTLALSGTVAGNTITGTWTLTGSSTCTGSGTFTMTKV